MRFIVYYLLFLKTVKQSIYAFSLSFVVISLSTFSPLKTTADLTPAVTWPAKAFPLLCKLCIYAQGLVIILQWGFCFKWWIEIIDSWIYLSKFKKIIITKISSDFNISLLANFFSSAEEYNPNSYD